MYVNYTETASAEITVLLQPRIFLISDNFLSEIKIVRNFFASNVSFSIMCALRLFFLEIRYLESHSGTFLASALHASCNLLVKLKSREECELLALKAK